MGGTGNLVQTGTTGMVMKESAGQVSAISAQKVDQLGIDPDFHNITDNHNHIPECAIPKDGPSAGITMTTALISALTHITGEEGCSETGEITLRGRVLPIVAELKESIGR
jgi:ATP-dependent Lon protease